MTKPVVSPFYSSKISLALQSARACALREQDLPRRFLLSKITGAQVRAGDWEGAYREVKRCRGSARRDVDDLKAAMLADMASSQVFLGDPYGALSTIRHALVLGYDGCAFFLTICRLAGMEGKIADESTANEALDLVERTTAEQLTKRRLWVLFRFGA